MICVALGIVLIHTRPKDGASKGKSERQWRTLKERQVIDDEIILAAVNNQNF